MAFCKIDGCEYYVFSRQLCLIHWKREFGKAPRRSSLKKSVRKIARVSNKKKSLDEKYYIVCREIDQQARDEKRWVCFFCGKPLRDACDHHHVAGKSGLSDNGISLYLDKEGIVLAHRECHREYHDILIEDLLKAPYYEALMKIIRYLCKSKYHDMKAKHDEHVKNL